MSLTTCETMISIKGFSYRFRGSDRDALHDVNLEIAKGEFVVVTGPSGCGKSTLALALGGFLFNQYDGEAVGDLFVSGLDVRCSPVYDVAEVVGLVQQNPENQFCTLTVQDEVAFGLENRCLPREEIRQRVSWALDIVGAAHLRDRALSGLSGGEKQRVAIAAVMAARPQILIFDEPTSNLDPSATAQIFDVIADIRARNDLTVVVIEHKTAYLRPLASRWVRMAEGSISTEGKCELPEDEQVWEQRSHECERTGDLLAQVEHLSVGYNGSVVLRDISLDLKQGEFVAVMGDNGSGKTTFLQCLLGLLKPNNGRVNVLGQSTCSAPISQLARQVAYVFQNPDHQLFAESVWAEATLAPRNFGVQETVYQPRARALLAEAGLAYREEEHPYRLSYGQKRRLNLISVLTYAPQLILLDEVLIGQDPENADRLLAWLMEHVDSGSTVILVNHAPEITWRYASRLLFFEEGQLVVDAPVGEGFANLERMGRQAYLPRAWGHWRNA